MPRTTVCIDDPVLREIHQIKKQSRTTMGDVITLLLIEALRARKNLTPPRKKTFRWHSQPMGFKVDLLDKEAVRLALEQDV